MPPNPKFDYQHVQKQLSLSGMSSWRGGDKLDIEKVRKHLESENEKASEYVEGLCSLKRSYEKINMESLHCSIASFSHSYLDPMKPNIPNNEENRRKLTRLIDHLNWLKEIGRAHV